MRDVDQIDEEEYEKFGFDVKIITPRHDFGILHPFWAYIIFIGLNWAFFGLLIFAVWNNITLGSILLFVVWALWRMKGKDILGIPEVALGLPEREE